MNLRERQNEQTEANIRQAFWQLYEQGPIEGISVTQVVQRAGYNRGTFYLHFKDIYDVLHAIEDDVLADLRGCVETCMQRLEAGEEPEQAMQDVLGAYEENREYLVVLMGPRGDARFVEQLKQELKPLWSTYVLGRKNSGGLYEQSPEGQETDLLLEYTLSGALFMIGRWLANPKGITPEKLLHLLYHSALGR